MNPQGDQSHRPNAARRARTPLCGWLTRAPAGVVTVYLGVAAAYFLLSNWAFDTLFALELTFTLYDTAKDFTFLILTAALLYVLVRTSHARIRASESSRHRYQLLFERSLDGIVLMDAHGRIHRANSAAADLLAEPHQTLIGAFVADFLTPPPDPSRTPPPGSTTNPGHERAVARCTTSAGDTRIIEHASSALGDGLVVSFLRDVTESHDVLEELRESRQRLALHIENTPLGYIEWDSSMRVTAWNSSAERIFGWPRREAVGLHAQDLIHESFKEGLEVAAHTLVARGNAFQSTNRNVTKDGRVITCSWSNTPLTDADGRPTGFASLVDDVTEQVATLERLREREDLLELINQNVRDMIARHAPGHGAEYRFVSDAARHLLGCNPADLVGTSPYDLFHPDDIPAIRQSHGRTLDGAPISMTYRLRRADGRYTWVESVGAGVPCPDAEGMLEIITVTRDVSERVAALAKVESSEQRFRLMFENAGVGVVLFDPHGVIRQPNPAFCQMLGYERDQLVGRSYAELSHPEDIAASAANIASLRDGTSDGYALEKRYIHRDGHDVWMSLNVTAVRDNQQRLVSGIAIFQDVTEEHDYRDQLREALAAQRLLLAELNHRVKNALGGLVTLIDLSAERATDVHTLAKRVRERVLAMTHVHEMLSASHYHAVTLEELARAMVPPEAAHRVRIAGTPVDIAPRQATPTGMILQELASNSLKHGALSTPAGAVELAWHVGNDRDHTDSHQRSLTLTWRETGGPPVHDIPEPNLGLQLIHGFARFELRGEARFSIREQSLVATIDATLDPTDAAADHTPGQAGAGDHQLSHR